MVEPILFDQKIPGVLTLQAGQLHRTLSNVHIRHIGNQGKLVRTIQNARARERKLQRYLSESEWSDFQPPVATKGPPEVEVEGPDEIETLEENDVQY